MKVKDVLKIAKIRLNNVVISKNDEALITMLTMGVAALYSKFHLSIKSETVLTNTDLSYYDCQANDLDMILSVTDRFGNELKQCDVYGSDDYDYELLNYRSFMLRKPPEGYVYCIYQATCPEYSDLEDEIDLPNCMMDALVNYMCYLGTSTINKDNVSESNIHYQRYLACCQELQNLGYGNINLKRQPMDEKGFI